MIQNELLQEKYLEIIEDVALDISQTQFWRNIIFNSEYEQRILISKQDLDQIPEYIKSIFVEDDLMFLVSKVSECPEEFDEGRVIFKFESLPFGSIVRYTGN